MDLEIIYDLISGKLIKKLENQPKEITEIQNKLDGISFEFQKSLNKEQSLMFNKYLDIYSDYLTQTNNFHFECGIEIGIKFNKALLD